VTRSRTNRQRAHAQGLTAASIINSHFSSQSRRHDPDPRGGQRRWASPRPIGRNIWAPPSSVRSVMRRKHGWPPSTAAITRSFIAMLISWRLRKRIVPGGVSAVFDGVGQGHVVKSFDCTAPFGMLVNYRQRLRPRAADRHSTVVAQGVVVGVPARVSQFLGDPERFRELAGELFDLVRSGVLRTQRSAHIRSPTSSKRTRTRKLHPMRDLWSCCRSFAYQDGDPLRDYRRQRAGGVLQSPPRRPDINLPGIAGDNLDTQRNMVADSRRYRDTGKSQNGRSGSGAAGSKIRLIAASSC